MFLEELTMPVMEMRNASKIMKVGLNLFCFKFGFSFKTGTLRFEINETLIQVLMETHLTEGPNKL